LLNSFAEKVIGPAEDKTKEIEEMRQAFEEQLGG
jgi:hypothetical protein